MRITWHPALALLLTSAFHAGTHAAGFDCGKAATAVEKLVCSDEVLSALDGHVSALFGRALHSASAPTELRTTQRHWLRQVRDLCVDKACLERSYRLRRAELERLAGRLNDLPDATLNRKVCDLVASPASRRALLATGLQLKDINNDGSPERWEACDGGTMRAPCTNYLDEDHIALRIQQVGFQWTDRMTFGEATFRHAGRTWMLHGYDDLAHTPAYVSYVTLENQEHLICEFENEFRPALQPGSSQAEAFCRGVLEDGARVRPLAMQLETRHPPHTLLRHNTTIGKTQWIDVDNDGKSERVVELFYSGTAGRGCEVNYFDILEEDGLQLSLKPLRERFLQMQMIGSNGTPQGRCMTENRMLLIDGVTYHESNVANELAHPRVLTRMTPDGSDAVCRYRIDVTTRVKSVR